MKYWSIIFSMLVISAPVWGQGVNQFTFVSALYTPIAIFDNVTIKDTVTISNGAVLNVGTSASEEGIIEIQGAAANIDSLKMDEGTVLSYNNGNTDDNVSIWFVKSLNIGPKGSVEVRQLIAKQITLENSIDSDPEQEKNMVNMKVKGELIADTHNIWTKTGGVRGELHVTSDDTTEQSQFRFVAGSKPEGAQNATWRNYDGTLLISTTPH